MARNHGGIASFRTQQQMQQQQQVHQQQAVPTVAVATVIGVAPGVASSSATTGAPVTARRNHQQDSENVHPNTVTAATAGHARAGTGTGAVKTPHAKPTNTNIIRVEAELLSRGPAAVVMDRNERRNEPIRTPQRFAVMYQCKASFVLLFTNS
jgi:hypothetical protein